MERDPVAVRPPRSCTWFTTQQSQGTWAGSVKQVVDVMAMSVLQRQYFDR